MSRLDEDEELRAACFELARTTKWVRKPIDSEEITALADELAAIARECLSEPLNIDLAVLTRAVRYLGQAHAMPPMRDDTEWFRNMLIAVLEVARPNSGLDEQGREFLRDMLDGISALLNDGDE